MMFCVKLMKLFSKRIQIREIDSMICAPCPTGQVLKTGTTDCIPCTLGKAATGFAVACTACAAGTYQDQNAATAYNCKDCSKAKYSSALGAISAATCLPCSAGKKSDVVGTSQSDCVACDKGRYQNEDGKEQCTICNAGLYQSSVGQTKCVKTNPNNVTYLSKLFNNNVSKLRRFFVLFFRYNANGYI